MSGKLFKYFSISIFFIVIIQILLLSISNSAIGQSGNYPLTDAVILGFVYDAEDNEYLVNVTISVERDNYLGNQTITDENGYYEMNIPSGHHIVRIFDTQGFVIYREEFNISSNEVKRLDFTLDSHDIDQSRVYGRVRNKFTYTPMEDAEIKIYRVYEGTKLLYRETSTDKDGQYIIYLPAGSYEMQVWADEEKLESKKFELNFAEEKEYDFVLQKPTRTFTLENIIRLITQEWLNIVAIIIILVIGILLNSFADKSFKAFEIQVASQPGRFMDVPIVRFIERVVKWNIAIIFIIIAVYLLAQILDAVTLLWVPISDSLASIYVIILLIIFLRISLMIWRQFILYLRGGAGTKRPSAILSSRMVTIIEIFGKYLMISLFLLGILLTAFAALGMGDIIVGGFTEGLANNAGFIILIISLIIITWVILRFSSSFFEDMKKRSSRFRPEMIDIASKGFKYFIYFIIGIIIIFTLLSAAGMGEIGQTIIIVFSLIIGLVVSMAATGSIGNILSGIVIMAFKPFEEGDWVIIGDRTEKHTGQIVESNLMFTKLRDLESEIIEIPNNFVLAGGIVNWTTAAKRGGFAVEVDVSIGYDVPAKQVITLMKESCEDIPGVLDSPKPHVVTTEFYNHAIGYKLRFYITSPQLQFKKRTRVMINMQKNFAEAGVEILSPEYFIRRSGKTPTVKEIKGKVRKISKFDKTVK